MTLEDRILKELKKRPGGATNSDLRIALFPDKGVGRHGDGYIPELDKALQKLRKAGEVVYEGRAWHLAARRKCAHCKGTGYTPA
jgi:hypothetical protein